MCLYNYIILCSKLARGRGGGTGVKNWQNLAYVVYGWSLVEVPLPEFGVLGIE